MPNRQTTSQSGKKGRDALVMNKEEFKKILLRSAESGYNLLKTHIISNQHLRNAQNAYYSWDEYNCDLLRSSFNNGDNVYLEQYAGRDIVVVSRLKSPQEEADDFYTDVSSKIRILESLAERVELMIVDKSLLSAVPAESTSQRPQSKSIFIVHGHASELKTEVARTLQQLRLNPIILHEQANGGRTVIEKFEESADVGFAVVLLTDDDLGNTKAKASEQLLPRARQNVVFELGYFIGRLKRKRVMALLSEGVEKPSDIDGFAYTPVDPYGKWKYDLVKELKHAGYKVSADDLS